MSSDTPTSTSRALARRLLVLTPEDGSGSVEQAVTNVTERLRLALTKFAGADSFASLLRRSVMLASAEVPALRAVKLGANGRLTGLDDAITDAAGADAAALAISTNLLELLNTFIGTPLTIKLIHTAWPDITFDTHQAGTEDEA
ncbi:MAG: hypothetical protein H7Z40_07940 [Phycisphaerae bacterium]|nr:hypothetical protein [Gemmatimonadaceae bacterium]